MIKHFNLSIPQVSFVIANTPLFTETVDKLVTFGQVVTRKSGEKVVIDLVLKSTTEPIHEELRNTMSSRNVASGGNL